MRETIIYSNYFNFAGRTFAYKDRVLFDITNEPKALFCINNKGYFGYWIEDQWLNENSIPSMIIKKPYEKIINK